MDGKLIVLLLLMISGIVWFFWGTWKIMIPLLLFMVNVCYFMFVILANHTSTFNLIIPGLIIMELLYGQVYQSYLFACLL